MSNKKSPEIKIGNILKQIQENQRSKAEFKELMVLIPRRREKWNFEGAGEQIESGITMSDIRRDTPERQTIKTHSLILADCLNHRMVALYVIDSESAPISELNPIPLLLDGFTSNEEAEKRMHDFYPDWKDGKTLARFTTFITYDKLLKLKPIQREIIVSQKLSLLEKMKTPILRSVFFPSLAFWVNYHGGNAIDWLNFLKDTQLAPDKLVQDRYSYLEKGAHHPTFKKILSRKTYEDKKYFDEIVLLKKPSGINFYEPH